MADLLGRVRTDKQLQDGWQVGLFKRGLAESRSKGRVNRARALVRI
ncbi:hypothetical protein PS838_05953 [Pseudomonas fluorescens]|jgi:hypothetical protein|nr:hypothetical protein PS838_05953 [Pseudomonas fluorescens]